MRAGANRRQACLRCDAGRGIGAGHLSRCLVLADALARQGWSCFFVMRQDPAGTDLLRSRYPCHVFDDTVTAAQEPFAMQQFMPEGCALLVVDHYQREASFETACRPWAERVLVIDDLADRRHDANLLVDATVLRQPGDYLEKVPAACTVLTGTRFALLRPEFLQWRAKARERRSAACQPRLLVGFGLLDGKAMIPAVLTALEDCDAELEIAVAVGQHCRHLDRIQTMARASRHRVGVCVDPTSMAELMLWAQLAIGAGGVSALERCCLGLPSLIIASAANQLLMAQALDSQGAAVFLGPAQTVSSATLCAKTLELLRCPQMMASMSERAFDVCDGRGVQRMLLALGPSTAMAGSTDVSLRIAEHEDSSMIHQWQCHPDTRRYFRNPLVPGRSEHQAWMRRTLDDPCRYLHIVLAGRQPAGLVRLDRVGEANDNRWEVSILVAPEQRGRGIGTAALTATRQVYAGFDLDAEIHPQNLASQKAFATAGFRRVDQNRYVADAFNRPKPTAIALDTANERAPSP